jgi:hypothetical protein
MQDLPDQPEGEEQPQQEQPNPYEALLQQLIEQQAQGFDEVEVLEDLADTFAEEDFDEEEIDAALPVIAGIAARVAARPLLQRGAQAAVRAAGRRIVGAATGAARQVVRRQGVRALRTLPRIAQGVARTAARRRMPARALAPTVQRVGRRVAASPQLARRLSRPSALPARPSRTGGTPRTFVIEGPVEVRIASR